MSKQVLVTGGAGFIGANFVYALLEKHPDWKITVVDLLTYAGNLENIEPAIRNKNVKFIKADICDSRKLEEVFANNNYNFIFHFAAESHVDRSILGPTEFVRTNVLGTQTLVNLALKYKIDRFIHISTDEVYGSLGKEGRFTENTALDPSSAYSASKAASDLLVLAACKTHNFNAIITRCTNNYGPYQFPEKLVALSVTNALENKKLPLYGNGENVRSWIYVKDHCEAVLELALKGKSGEVYNIGGYLEDEISNRVMLEKILQTLGKSQNLIELVKDRPGHDFRYAVDSTKTFMATGWKPKISLEAGLELTIKWYQDNQNWWAKIKTGEYLEYYKTNYQADLGVLV